MPATAATERLTEEGHSLGTAFLHGRRYFSKNRVGGLARLVPRSAGVSPISKKGREGLVKAYIFSPVKGLMI